jgi:glycosyltransferase involved in cell wall biosynthesis
MRLLLIHNYYREKGGENAAFDLLVRLLREQGHDLAQYSRHSMTLDRLSIRERVKAFAAGFHSSRTVREVTQLVRSHRPQVALVQNVFPLISPSVFAALRRLEVPAAHLVYNYRMLCPDGHLYTQGGICRRCVRGSTLNAAIHRCYRSSRLFSAWYAGIVGWHRAKGTFSSIDHFLVPDRFMVHMLGQGGLPTHKMTVMGNPFDVGDYPLSLEEDGYLLFIGRLVPQKGIFTLVRAFAKAAVSSRLFVVGDGASRSEAEKLAEALAPGRIFFLGALWGDEVRGLLSRCLGLCIPSEWYDSAPLVLYQAYSTGKPVIASRIHGLSEAVTEGEDGLLAATGNVEDWARRIEQLVGNRVLRRHLGENARKKAETTFSSSAYRGRLDRAIHGLLRG